MNQEPDGPEGPDEPDEDAARESERRRRRARVFGDVLPEVTRDERGDGQPGERGESSDDWLRRQVPPHHG